MTNTITASEALTQVQDSAAAVSEATRMRFYRVHTIGDEIRQGDVYLWPTDASPAKLKETKNRQLAPGNTKGSRHIIEGEARVYQRTGDPTLGPLLVVDKRATLTHPEHGHVSLCPGKYGVTYQIDHAAEERARVQD